MNYQKIYDDLMLKGRKRGNIRSDIDFYVERHHIVPKCLGGSNHSDNLVFLTASEHFVAHQLLVKIFPNNHSISHAAKILMGSANANNKQFEWVRKRAVETSVKFHTGRKRSDETRANISKSLLGKKPPARSDEHRANLSKALKGKPLSEEHKSKLANREITDEWKNKISKANKGQKRSDEQKANLKKILSSPEVRKRMSESAKNSIRYECEHCGIVTNRGNHNRWHGTNCKKAK